MRISIGLLLSAGFPVPVPFVLGLMENVNAIASGGTNAWLPPDLQINALRLITAQGFPVDAARNEVCRTFLDTDGGDFLYFMDADMRHPPQVLAQLLMTRERVVTGRYQMRKPPFHTVAMRHVGPDPFDYQQIREQTGVVPIDAAGAGALLIHRSVLEAIRANLGRDEWFKYQMGPKTGLRTVSEDIWFFQQVARIGVQAWCDLDAACTHASLFEVDGSWQEPWIRREQEARDRMASV